MNGKLPTKEEYIKTTPKIVYNLGWSAPKYECPKCGGGMCQNLEGGIMLTSNPPIYKNEYGCNNCYYVEYLEV